MTTVNLPGGKPMEIYLAYVTILLVSSALTILWHNEVAVEDILNNSPVDTLELYRKCPNFRL